MKTIVIYHAADFAGIFCREVARRFFGESADYVGWDYGQPTPIVGASDLVYMMDISIEGLMDHPNLVWIDHHKSAIEKYPAPIKGYRIDGVAACRLAWQWFLKEWRDAMDLPDKRAFVDRQVQEPTAVRLAGEYDVWDRRSPTAELFQHGLRSQELVGSDWEILLTERMVALEQELVGKLLAQGRIIQYAQTRQDQAVIETYGFTFQWEGLTFLGCNAARFNSHLFAAALRPEHDACFGFNWSGVEWRVSLYGVPGKDIDLAAIAVRHGGGGHKQACGFRTNKLPFLT